MNKYIIFFKKLYIIKDLFNIKNKIDIMIKLYKYEKSLR